MSMRGMCEYYHDAIYIAIALQFLTCLSDRMWFLILIVPGYGLFQLWKHVLGPYFSGPGEERELTEVERKKLEKAERRAESRRRKFLR